MNSLIQKILFETNQFCNLNCEYCFYNDVGKSDKYLTCEDIKNVCEKYPSANEFFLTGGECTLNNDFNKLIDYLALKGKVIIFTNGLNFYKKNNKQISKLLEKLYKIIITYDSANPGYFLRKGLEKQIFRSIKKVAEINSSKLEVKVCLNKLNLNDFEKTINELIKNNIKYISVNYIKNISKSEKNFELSYQEILRSFEIIRKYERYFNKKNIDFVYKSYKNNFNNAVKCIAGKRFVYIDCFGNEFYCPSSSIELDQPKKKQCFGKHCINIWELFV